MKRLMQWVLAATLVCSITILLASCVDKVDSPVVPVNSMEELAQQCGFRSYSTFATAFKQFNGQTITAWMKIIILAILYQL